MTLILETGTGVRNANSYITSAFVTSYLTARNRLTENNWSASTSQDASCIAATQYVDIRWGQKFRGTRRFYFDGVQARAIISFAGVPLPDETVTIGSQTYRWVAELNGFDENQVLATSNVTQDRAFLINAINANCEVIAQAQESAQILLISDVKGVSGNDTPLDVSNATQINIVETFQYGEDEGSQPLEFPRRDLFDRSGRTVHGIPRSLKEAVAEYAVRSHATSLFQDPVTDSTGRIVQEKFEKVGPIEERTVYAQGTTLQHLIKPYPAADRLLSEYLQPAGVIR